MTAGDAIKQIQNLVGVAADGRFGPQSLGALHQLIMTPSASPWPPPVVPSDDGDHAALATSFADPADVAAYRAAIAAGHDVQYALSVGDNGIGAWGDDVTGPTPACALPPEIWLAQWDSKDAAHNRPVLVTANGRSVNCLLQDTMPHLDNIKNGAGIDLNPAAVAALGLTPPLKAPVRWRWSGASEDA